MLVKQSKQRDYCSWASIGELEMPKNVA